MLSETDSAIKCSKQLEKVQECFGSDCVITFWVMRERFLMITGKINVRK